MSPSYSFIIPARNERFLLETVSNIRRLGDTDRVEIIVVDDASDTLIEDMPGLARVFRLKEQRGVAFARSYGASVARGEVLVFTDGHVAFSDNYLAAIHRAGVSDAYGGIVGCITTPVGAETFAKLSDGRHSLDPDLSGHCGWCVKIGPPLGVRTVVASGRAVFDVPYVGACALAISRLMYEYLGGFDEGLIGFGSLEDCELGMRCRALGFPVQSVLTACCWHHLDIVRRFGAGFRDNPHAALDHLHYIGSFMNTIRVIGVHFPTMWLEQFCVTHARAATSSETLRSLLACDEIKARRAWLDGFRRVSHASVLKQMTRTT